MLIDAKPQEIITLLLAVFGLIKTGLLLSGFMYVSHKITDQLAQVTRVDKSDPTLYFQRWEQLFSRMFLPIGKSVIRKNRKPVTNQALFQLSIGLVAVVFTMAFYVLFSGTVLGLSVATYYTAGFVPDLSSLIQQVAAFAVLFGISIIFHAGERAEDVVPVS